MDELTLWVYEKRVTTLRYATMRECTVIHDKPELAALCGDRILQSELQHI
jgi:hypothetical protein